MVRTPHPGHSAKLQGGRRPRFAEVEAGVERPEPHLGSGCIPVTMATWRPAHGKCSEHSRTVKERVNGGPGCCLRYDPGMGPQS